MTNKNTFTRILAIAGTVLLWIPLLAPLLFGLLSWIVDGMFRFDYLMPAGLFLLVLAGGGLLLWAAWRAQVYFGLVAWGLGIAVVALISAQFSAIVTGLASGDTPTGGWQWMVALALLAIYTISVAVTGAGGLLLLRHLFQGALPRSEQ